MKLKELNYKLKNTKGNIHERIKIIKERTKLLSQFKEIDNEITLYNALIKMLKYGKKQELPIELYTELEHLFSLVKKRIDIYEKEIDKLEILELNISKHLTNHSPNRSYSHSSSRSSSRSSNHSSRNSSDSLYGGRKLLKSYKKL